MIGVQRAWGGCSGGRVSGRSGFGFPVRREGASSNKGRLFIGREGGGLGI